MDWSDGIQGLIKKAKAVQKQANPDDDDYRSDADDWFDEEDTLFGTIKDIQSEGGSLIMFLIEDESGATMMVPAEARMAINALEDAFGSVQDAIGETIYFTLTDYGTMAGFDTGKMGPGGSLNDYYQSGEEMPEGQEKLFSKDNISKEASSLLMVIQNLRNMPTAKLLENLDFIKSQLTEKIVTLSKQAQGINPGEYMKDMFDRKDKGLCPFCGKKVDPDSFRDELSRKEFRISGLCQECQDDFFKEESIKGERKVGAGSGALGNEINSIVTDYTWKMIHRLQGGMQNPQDVIVEFMNKMLDDLIAAVGYQWMEDKLAKQAQQFPQRSRGTSDEYFTLMITLNHDGSIQAENNAKKAHREWADQELGDDFHNLVAWIKDQLTQGRLELTAPSDRVSTEEPWVEQANDSMTKEAQSRIPISSLQIPHTVVKALHRKGITFIDQIDANLEVIRETLTEAQMAQLSRGLEQGSLRSEQAELSEPEVSPNPVDSPNVETAQNTETEVSPEEDLLEVAASMKKIATQGAYIGSRRPKTKKELKEAIQANPDDVSLEATSIFGNEYGGPISQAPPGNYYVVGPDPYTKRTWYAQIIVGREGIKVK